MSQATAPATASELLDLTVLDLDKKPVRLGDIVGGKPAVLVFLRHFG